MPIKTISYNNTGYFSKLICDYLSEKKDLRIFYNHFPTLENLGKQIKLKEKSFNSSKRKVLVERLKFQYRDISISKSTQKSINSLLKDRTFTITTGHQLNLFTGPLYFLYKIFSVINLSEKLNKVYPNHHFVPIFWMASEDHDFGEINYFNLFGNKVQWGRESVGAVGELSTEGLEVLLNDFKRTFGDNENAHKLTSLFSKAYLKHNNLADATRYLANGLFSDYGLVIIDGNDTELKKQFIPYAEKELTENLAFNIVNETTKRLENIGYGKQVHPREINLFYLKKGLRERIIEKDGMFYINNTEISFNNNEFLKELQNAPERFSPNVLLRPLYQEVVLPNLCYVGGGGELAYWFQLKDYFKSVEVPFPVLLLRNSVLLVSDKLSKKLMKLNEDIESLFLSQHILEAKHTRQLSDIKIDFTPQRELLKKQFEDLYLLAKKTDASFLGAVGAQEKKQLNGLDKLEKRLLKAQKRKLLDELTRLVKIQDELFPNQSLQERILNFSEFYLIYGDKLLPQIKDSLDPLCNEFTVLYLNEK